MESQILTAWINVAGRPQTAHVLVKKRSSHSCGSSHLQDPGSQEVAKIDGGRDEWLGIRKNFVPHIDCKSKQTIYSTVKILQIEPFTSSDLVLVKWPLVMGIVHSMNENRSVWHFKLCPVNLIPCRSFSTIARGKVLLEWLFTLSPCILADAACR